MPSQPPPNDKVAGLIAILGETDTRELVEIFLTSSPTLLGEIASADRTQGERAAHSLKSSSRQMGLPEMAQKMAALEQRLRESGPAVDAAEQAAIARDFDAAVKPLRDFVG